MLWPWAPGRQAAAAGGAAGLRPLPQDLVAFGLPPQIPPDIACTISLLCLCAARSRPKVVWPLTALLVQCSKLWSRALACSCELMVVAGGLTKYWGCTAWSPHRLLCRSAAEHRAAWHRAAKHSAPQCSRQPSRTTVPPQLPLGPGHPSSQEQGRQQQPHCKMREQHKRRRPAGGWGCRVFSLHEAVRVGLQVAAVYVY